MIVFGVEMIPGMQVGLEWQYGDEPPYVQLNLLIIRITMYYNVDPKMFQ